MIKIPFSFIKVLFLFLILNVFLSSPNITFAQFCGGPGSYTCCTDWQNSCYRFVNGQLEGCPASEDGINGCSCGSAVCNNWVSGTCPATCSPCINGDGNQNTCTAGGGGGGSSCDSYCWSGDAACGAGCGAYCGYTCGGGPPPPPPAASNSDAYADTYS